MERFVVRRARSPQSPRRVRSEPRSYRQATLESLKASPRAVRSGSRSLRRVGSGPVSCGEASFMRLFPIGFFPEGGRGGRHKALEGDARAPRAA